MPYIKQEQRSDLDVLIRDMKKLYRIEANGDLNYVLYSFCKRYVPRSYNSYKNFCGELRQCATEIERRILGSYEDEKIIENGDC